MGKWGPAVKIVFRPLIPDDIITVQRYLPFVFNPSTRGIVAYDQNTHLTAAVFIAQEWTKTSVQVHQVIIRPMVIRHGWFEEIADFMFNRAGRLKLYALVPDNNPRALAVNEKCGFVEKARLEDAYDIGVDYIVMELKREDCPFWHQVTLKEVAYG